MRFASFLLFLLSSINVFSQKQSTVTVTVNRETQLFAIVTYLSGNIQFVIPSDYESAVKKEFKSFKKHPAVSEIKNLYKGKDFYIEAVHPMLGFRCSSLPELKIIYTPDHVDLAALEKYLQYLRNFADEIAYQDFYDAHRPAMEAWEKPVLDTIVKYEMADKLGNLFRQHKTFTVHLNPFNSWGGQAFVPNEHYADTNASFILGYNSYTASSGKDKPPFFNSRAMLVELLWHEGAHTYINARIKKNLKLFDESQSLLNEQRQTTLQKAGKFKWEWEYFLDEQITRATVAYLLLINMGEVDWLKECARQEQMGFTFTKEISLLLKTYDNDKAKYPDFTDFLPTIADFLKVKAKNSYGQSSQK
ncbi:DUF4932 domain-containing protein [Pseudochryseolinea flava]|uniref:DUF4932 domain-containing protein n=1 Tax=Pseudochryseolinea flava TaxID=2059302 RepID=A0A364XV29_9BACT|nr:DUF4932 domain-containing protein [Pseudochryseolinea flava]RAV98164.1 hypothetical protein DQQ10_25190 [Pseudochryseolinea flava]